MNCQDFEATILSMARAQLLDSAARRQTLAHIATCQACADLLADQQTLTAIVRQTARSLREENASVQVEGALRAAFRKQTLAAAAPVANSSVVRRWLAQPSSRRALLATAAALLLFLFLGMRQWARTGQPAATVATVPTPSAPNVADTRPTPVPPEQAPARHLARSVRRPPSGVRPRAVSGDEYNEFIVLANDTQLVPLESGQVLRVEVPTSTLISMGLRITAEDVSKPVLADLLVGQDGLPRAIRFVRSGNANDGGLPPHSINK